jgi:hypothetical protein
MGWGGGGGRRQRSVHVQSALLLVENGHAGAHDAAHVDIVQHGKPPLLDFSQRVLFGELDRMKDNHWIGHLPVKVEWSKGVFHCGECL